MINIYMINILYNEIYYFILSCGNHYIIKIIFGKNILEINIYLKNNN